MADLVWVALPGRPWTCARVLSAGYSRGVLVTLFGTRVTVERRHLRAFGPGCRALAARRGP